MEISHFFVPCLIEISISFYQFANPPPPPPPPPLGINDISNNFMKLDDKLANPRPDDTIANQIYSMHQVRGMSGCVLYWSITN